MSYEMNAEGVNGVNSITIIQANDWPVLGVRPKRWTVSCGGLDRLPGVIILELCRA
jgi:hypothetical protein